MQDLISRKCKFCGKEFVPEYTTTGYSVYNDSVVHCSKSCAVSATRSITTEELRQEILAFIRSTGRYCTTVDITTGVNRSSKTIIKHGLSIKQLNNECGYSKPKSAFQRSVGEILQKEFDVVLDEQTFDGLVGTTGSPLRVDFVIPELSLVVEADGYQHKYVDHPWAQFKNGSCSEYDEIKGKFFSNTDLKLCRIPYRRKVSKEFVLSCIKSCI